MIDETSFHKQGNKTACVQRQWCGSRGKKDNCVVSVHLGYATPEFYSLIDGELYLPEAGPRLGQVSEPAAGPAPRSG